MVFVSVVVPEKDVRPGKRSFAPPPANRFASSAFMFPVIVTSVHEASEQALKFGARAYVNKPIDRHVLQAALSVNIREDGPGDKQTDTAITVQAANG